MNTSEFLSKSKIKNAEYVVLEEVLRILESGRPSVAVERIKVALELLK